MVGWGMGTCEVGESVDYEKVWKALLRRTPRDILANASAGLLWRVAAAVFTFGAAVGGAGFWVGDRLASNHEVSLNLQIDTLKHDLAQSQTNLKTATDLAAKIDTDKRHDEVFLTTYLRYLMSLNKLESSNPELYRCQFIKLQVDMYRNQFGLNPDSGVLQKILGSNPSEDASVPVQPYGTFRIPPDIQRAVVKKATGTGSDDNCSG
jgi:hypothetical protein